MQMEIAISTSLLQEILDYFLHKLFNINMLKLYNP